MSGGKERAEGRLSRWSQRKLARGDSDGLKPDGAATPAASVAVAEASSETMSRSGGLTARGFVQPMRPLAGPEEGETAYEAAPADALALFDPGNGPENAPENAEAAALQAFPAGPEGEDENAPLTPEQEAAVKDLPPVESLKKDSDFTPFFGPNIPDFLKRQAFKALWLSNPFFGFRDGLNDYDLNYRIVQKILTAADSAYKAGKGYDFGEDKADDDIVDGDDDGEGKGEEVITAAEDSADDTPKEPRKSDVRPPDDAV
ncbi:MAG: DUF3306 domain-containing protein [Proteobacteria bacterium]|nr:DUF3306 domain-containing protein [Pseudomonadota bacterium]